MTGIGCRRGTDLARNPGTAAVLAGRSRTLEAEIMHVVVFA